MLTDRVYHYDKSFELESGATLPELQLYYSTYGKPNEDRSNVVWVCHAFSGSSDVSQWWPGLFGKGKLYDPETFFVVCVNMPGGCYGSTGPLSVNPETGKKYYHDFPLLTNKDMVRAFDLVRRHLAIERIHTVIGCSMGGQHAIEWAVQKPDLFEHVVAIGANARHSPWAIAFNETQRMAIEADPSWPENRDDAGINGMKAARAVGLLSYRSYLCYKRKQSEETDEKFDDFKASSYQQYQGYKITQRFNAFTYWYLSKAMDSQNVGRGNGGLDRALQKIKARCLFIGINHDILFPTVEQMYLAEMVENGSYAELDSYYGHDGFLLEFERLTQAIQHFYMENPQSSALPKAV
jgi:homoserine O-acetyltransferase